MLALARHRDQLAREVRAARRRRQPNALHWQLRVRVQQLRQHALDLDARCPAVQLDTRRVPATNVLQDVPLEFGMRGGGVEIGKEIGHVLGR